jgi:hypothetical protein
MTDLSFLVEQVNPNFSIDFSDLFINRYVTEDSMIYILPKDSNSVITSKNFEFISNQGIFPLILEKYDAITHDLFVCEKTESINSYSLKELEDLIVRFHSLHSGGYSIDIQNFMIEKTKTRYVVRPTGFLQDQFSLLFRYAVNKNNIDINKLKYSYF